MDELRILSVSPAYHPAIAFGGPITALRSLNKHLKASGAMISVVTTTSGIPETPSQKRRRIVDGIPVTYFPVMSVFEKLTPTGWHFSIPIFLHILNQARNIDIIYCRSLWNFPTLACYAASILHKKPLIIAATGKLTPEAFSIKATKKKLFWNLIFKRIVRHATIHYVSELEKEISEKNISIFGNSIVIETGTDFTDVSARKIGQSLKFSDADRDIKKILFLGRVHPIKGLDILVDAYSEVLSRECDATLIISGPFEGGFHYDLKHRIRQLGLEFLELSPESFASVSIKGKVVFTGAVRGDAKKFVLSESDIYCQFSVSEGFSNSIIEAMAFSLPIVISKGCNFSPPELSTFGYLASDASTAARSMIALLKDDKKRSDFASNAYAHVAKFHSWNNIAVSALNKLKRLVLNEEK